MSLAKRVLLSVILALVFLFPQSTNVAQAGGPIVTIIEARWGEYENNGQFSGYRTRFKFRSTNRYEAAFRFLYNGGGTWNQRTTYEWGWSEYGFVADGGSSTVYQIEAGFANSVDDPMVSLYWNWQACQPGPYELFERDQDGVGHLLVVNVTSNALNYDVGQAGWVNLQPGQKIIREGVTGTVTLRNADRDAEVCTEITWHQIPDGSVAPDPVPTSTAGATTTPGPMSTTTAVATIPPTATVTPEPVTPPAGTQTPTLTPRVIFMTPVTSTPTPPPIVTAVATETAPPTATPPAWLGPVEVSTGWNLVGFPCAPLCARSASEALASFQESGLDVIIAARWVGLWEVHIRGLGANDFTLNPKMGYFIRSRNSGTWEWYMPPTPIDPP